VADNQVAIIACHRTRYYLRYDSSNDYTKYDVSIRQSSGAH